jgi:hypothetical protein
MSKQFSETNEQTPTRRIGSADAYSARIQEAMRYNKLRSSEYPLVMTILRAVKQGFTEERWQEEQKSLLKTLANQPTDKGTAHSDASNRYEQAVLSLKDLTLWPW